MGEKGTIENNKINFEQPLNGKKRKSPENYFQGLCFSVIRSLFSFQLCGIIVVTHVVNTFWKVGGAHRVTKTFFHNIAVHIVYLVQSLT